MQERQRLSTTTRVKTTWKKFKDLLPVLSSGYLSFKTRGCMYSSCFGAQCSMPARLGHWQSQTASVCSEMTGQWSDRSAMSDHKTLSPPGPVSYLCGLALRTGPHSEGEKTPMVWICGTLQWCSQDSLWHTDWWKAWAWEAQDDMETADREGLQRVEALGHRPSCLFVLRFYGPVNPMGSCRARSVYLTTHLLGRHSPLSG